MLNKFLLSLVFLLSLSASATPNYRVITERGQKLVLFEDATIARAQEIAQSNRTREEKQKILKALFFVIGASLGDGKSYCDVVNREYFPTESQAQLERCMKAITSEDFLYNMTDDIGPVEDVGTVNLLLAKTAKLLILL